MLLPESFLAAVMVYELIDEMFQQLLEQDHGVLGVLRRDRGGLPRCGVQPVCLAPVSG